MEYSFIETTQAMHPMYVIRALGGILFLIGGLIMAFNIVMTIVSPDAADVPEEGPKMPAIPALAPAE